MSKNFELLQQAGSNGGPVPSMEAPRLTALRYGKANGHGNGQGKGRAERLDLDRIAEEESLRLVQATFLGPADNRRLTSARRIRRAWLCLPVSIRVTDAAMSACKQRSLWQTT